MSNIKIGDYVKYKLHQPTGRIYYINGTINEIYGTSVVIICDTGGWYVGNMCNVKLDVLKKRDEKINKILNE